MKFLNEEQLFDGCTSGDRHTFHPSRNSGYRTTLVAEGQHPYDSAMARAVGLTTAAAAKAFLLGNIKVRGFRLPLTPDIYEPVLYDLTELGVDFHFREKKVYRSEQIKLNLNLN